MENTVTASAKNIYIIAIELDMFVEKENKHVVELKT